MYIYRQVKRLIAKSYLVSSMDESTLAGNVISILNKFMVESVFSTSMYIRDLQTGNIWSVSNTEISHIISKDNNYSVNLYCL